MLKVVKNSKNIAWKFYSAKEFGSWLNEWNGLNDRSVRSVLLDADYFRLLLKEFGRGKELLALAHCGEQLVACGLLESPRPGVWQTFQPSQAPLGAWLYDTGWPLDEVLAELQKKLPGICLLLGITQQDPEFFPRPENMANVRTLDYIKTARITVLNSFDEYWSQRGKNLRHNLKRQRNRLAREEIETGLEVVRDSGEFAACVRDYGIMESSGWKAEGGTAIHPENAQGRFYQQLLETRGQKGGALVCRYYYKEQLVATDLCIIADGVLVILKTTHDESREKTSPAMLMRQEFFQQVFSTGEFKKIEFYGKLMDWHTKWTDEVRQLYHVNRYRWPWLAVLLGR